MTMLLLMGSLCGLPRVAVSQVGESAQLLLNVEKLNQFKQILDDMYTGYRTLSRGYNAVRDIASGNFSLHKLFIDGLSAVSPVVKRYHKVGGIINYQKLVLEEYRRAYRQFINRGNFNRGELDYLAMVYGNLLDMSARNIEELLLVVTGGKLQMTDEERMAAIDRIFDEIKDRYVFVRIFNNEAAVLNRQRKQASANLETIKSLQP
ncbi:TerB family tellurite resistance protein [Echinicola strongylocentroti]|uniref:TerB family tellurite resistance protein n=1 Tax=Echinicola strongylocentroti TaxID=1795355 RepID=A0A2Z4IPH0_9BACT|nr:TerB family tellurite resistance protein [Echinicola strongylocentroti]